MQAATGRFEMRLEPNELNRIDEWRGQQPDVPTRSEAVRRLLNLALTPRDEALRMSATERLITWLLCDVLEGLKVKSEIAPSFIKEVIIGGHFWAIDHKHSGLLGAQPDDRHIVDEVINYLDMWLFIEDAAAKLTKKEREAISTASGWPHFEFRFIGFDHKEDEIQYLSIANFFVEQLGTFSFLKGRDLDAHYSTLDTHRQMYAVFDNIRPKLIGRELNTGELTSILKARR